ncbi:MAG: hypothetical protein ACYSWQ_26405 [Planctomycetota bacterium]
MQADVLRYVWNAKRAPKIGSDEAVAARAAVDNSGFRASLGRIAVAKLSRPLGPPRVVVVGMSKP